jgi:CBS domain containing-hemolysin-like protein
MYPLPAGASYFRPRQEMPARVRMENPAIFGMTDLRQVTAVTVDPNVSIDTALQKMIENDVRLLLVVNTQQLVIGLITATDIQGEKPLKFLTGVGVRYEEILVRDIMTPREALQVARFEDVLSSSIGDIVETLKRAGRQHALVIDTRSDTMTQCVRGIFSATQLSRQLGVEINTSRQAGNFAALNLALNNQV